MTWSRQACGISLVLATFALVVVAAAPAARAGGSWMYPVQDQYQPGDTVTLVGYTSSGSQGSLRDGPFYGYLYRSPTSDTWVAPRAIPLPVGEIDFETAEGSMRASIEFELPDDVPAGMYWMDYCNQTCDERFGDLIGAVFSVGQELEWDIVRSWPADEPEIERLDDDSLLSVLGTPLTARAFRDLADS